MERERDDSETARLRELADRLGLNVGAPRRTGVEGNTAGIETEDLLFSRRLDSRTFFVQNRRFGVSKEGGGSFEGPDDELLGVARDVMERLELPVEEIAETSLLTEQAQEGEVDQDTGKLRLEDAYVGKRLVLVTRQVEKLPVWSSSVTLGVIWDRSIGFLQAHWPEIPREVVDRAHKLQSLATQDWRPPERPGAKVESVEAGIIHSPAVGFVMDFAAAIRVIYAPTDASFGKKPVLYVDEGGNDVPIPRVFEKFEEPILEARPQAPNRDEIHLARGRFRQLLLSNPNYFGTLTDVVLKPQLPLQKDTFYEEIGCIGYEPQLKRLEAASKQLEQRRTQLAFSEKRIAAFEARAGELAQLTDEIDAKIAVVRRAAGGRLDQLELNALVQYIEITEDRRAAVEPVAAYVGGDPDVMLAAPYLLIGTVDEIVEQLHRARDRWGFTYFVTRSAKRTGQVIAAIRSQQ